MAEMLITPLQPVALNGLADDDDHDNILVVLLHIYSQNNILLEERLHFFIEFHPR